MKKQDTKKMLTRSICWKLSGIYDVYR